MNLKTYTARSMPEALAAVRAELGANAVILHTRSYRRGGLLGLGAKTIVEVTAADGQEVGQVRRRVNGPSPRAAAVAQWRQARPRPRPEPPAVEPVSPSAGDLIRRTYAAAKAELSTAAAQADAAIASTSGTAHVHPLTPPGEQLTDEVRAIKRMVERMMRQQKRRAAEAADEAAPPDLPDKLFDQYLTLLRNEVTEELAEEIVAQVRASLTDEQMDDEQAVQHSVRKAVAGLLPTDTDTGKLTPRPDGRPRVIALVGPTGVGKTTTVAKLAATFKLKQAKQVALITLDTYRIAAVDQLRTYAGIIGVPLHVVMSPAELHEAIARCRGCDVVLIDTAGRSQRDDLKLHELSQFMAAASPDEVHLVLSSTCTQAVLLEAVERFSAIRTDRIIFTKLDEAVSFGVLLNVARRVNKKLSYITTGQEVPHQIEAGRSERLAALVIGSEALDPTVRGR